MKRWTRGSALALALGLGMVGCGKKDVPAPAGDTGSVTAPGGGEEQNIVEPKKPTRKPHSAPHLHMSFKEAVLPRPPRDRHRPPDTTCTGKSVGKLYTDVVDLWDTIEFTKADGTAIEYRARLDCELGTIVIELKPEWAPNHARGFIALARTGYYDGLVFERIIKDASTQVPAAKLEMIEGGCPLGTGAMGYGSIGYWLRPEPHEDASHVPGAVGACNSAQEDAGACKFYINLSEAPFLDGHFTLFGKVVEGLDVAQKILGQPVRRDAEYPAGDRPVDPVVINKVTIETSSTVEVSKK